MIIALTGTPGTGKTSVSKVLEKNFFYVVDLNKIAVKKSFVLGNDKVRNSKIVDIERLNEYINNFYSNNKTVFVEGHLSHLLKSVDKVIVLRCSPKELRNRLYYKGWNEDKIRENVEAEILDIILCESVEIHYENNIFEIDTTGNSVEDVAFSVIEIVNNDFRNMRRYNIGNIDWSDDILDDF